MTGEERRRGLTVRFSGLRILRDSIVTTELWKLGGSFREFTVHWREGRHMRGVIFVLILKTYLTLTPFPPSPSQVLTIVYAGSSPLAPLLQVSSELEIILGL